MSGPRAPTRPLLGAHLCSAGRRRSVRASERAPLSLSRDIASELATGGGADAVDEDQRCRGAGRDSCIRPAERKTACRHDPPSRYRGTSSRVADVGECLQAAESRLGPQALTGSPARHRRCAQLQWATWPPRRAFAQIHACSASAGTTALLFRPAGARLRNATSRAVAASCSLLGDATARDWAADPGTPASAGAEQTIALPVSSTRPTTGSGGA